MPRSALLILMGVLVPCPRILAQDVAVYHVAITGSIDLGAQRLVARALQAAEDAGGSAVILEIRSPGGRFDMAQLIMDDVEATGLSVYALVGAEAWGAAALVALAADSLFMGPSSSIGAGRPPTKATAELTEPALGALGRAFSRLAERRGVDARLGEAMVRTGPGIPGVVRADSLLTLDAGPAVDLRVAVAEVADLPALLQHIDLGGATVVTVGTAWKEATIEVTNHNWGDVRIYVLRGGSRFRLGTVTSMNQELFEVPAAFLGPGSRIQLLAEVIGSSRRVTTDPIYVEPGLVIQWVIENVLSQSNYFVWVRT